MFCFFDSIYALSPCRLDNTKDKDVSITREGIIGVTRYDPFSEYLPENHGVYKILSRYGTVKYIGSSNNIHSRMTNHVRSGVLKKGNMVEAVIFSKDTRQKKIFDYERGQIKKLNPLYNKHTGTPGKSWNNENVHKLGEFYKINKNSMEGSSRKIVLTFLHDRKKTCQNFNVIQSFLRVMKHFK